MEKIEDGENTTITESVGKVRAYGGVRWFVVWRWTVEVRLFWEQSKQMRGEWAVPGRYWGVPLLWWVTTRQLKSLPVLSFAAHESYSFCLEAPVTKNMMSNYS